MPNHPRLDDVKPGTIISVEQFGSRVGATVTSVVTCKKVDSMGMSLKVINIKSNSGAVLQESYIYSNSHFDILKRPPSPKSNQNTPDLPTDLPKNVKDIKPGDRFTNSKHGDDNTVLVVVETKQTKTIAQSGAWKGQVAVNLKVRAEHPNAEIEEGTTISTGDENTIWMESGEREDPSINDEMHIESMEDTDVPENVTIAAIGETNDTAMTGYPDDLLVIRQNDSAPGFGWHFGNRRSRYFEARAEHLSGSLVVSPTVDTPTFKGHIPLHPLDPKYEKSTDQREYVLITARSVGDTYTGGDTALFTLNEASVGRAGSRSYKRAKVGDFQRLNDNKILFVRMLLKPSAYMAGDSFKYGDGHVVAVGTLMYAQTKPEVPPRMANVVVTLNSMSDSLSVSEVVGEIYLPESGLGGLDMRKQLQGDVRTSFLKDTSNTDIFSIKNIINLSKGGNDLPLCCVEQNTTGKSKNTRHGSKRKGDVDNALGQKKKTASKNHRLRDALKTKSMLEKENAKLEAKLAQLKKQRLAHDGQTVNEGDMWESAGSQRKSRHAQETESADKTAELKLKMTEASYEKLMASQAQNKSEMQALYERMIENVESSRASRPCGKTTSKWWQACLTRPPQICLKCR